MPRSPVSPDVVTLRRRSTGESASDANLSAVGDEVTASASSVSISAGSSSSWLVNRPLAGEPPQRVGRQHHR